MLSVPQAYNQHYGVERTAPHAGGPAAFFVKVACPEDGVVLDPFSGSATTQVVARRLGRQAGGLEVHDSYVESARDRLARDEADDPPGVLRVAV